MGKNRDRTRRSSAAELLETPPLTPPSATDSPKSAIFSRKINGNVSKFSSPENTNTAKNRVTAGLFKSSSRNISSLFTISDLKDVASSQLHDLKRLVDHSHPQIVEDIESSNSRLQKRFKIQSQACQKMMDEVEKEKKKMSQRIYEICKTSITEVSQSFERSTDALRSRFGIPST
ncbi:hypothetical protein SDJN02_03031, partial [Cucurbita argyrosperma subsp. argyrosperma]